MREKVKLPIKEKEIEKSILLYLEVIGIFSFKVKSMGTYDSAKKIYRKKTKYFKTGVSDIIALYKGSVIFIEVKSPTGTLSAEQVAFRNSVLHEGAHYILARSIDDVKNYLDQYFH